MFDFPPVPHSVPIAAQDVGVDWGPAISTWRGAVITLYVVGGPLRVQFAPDQPPSPPTWDAPFVIGVGPWSHSGVFGYVRFASVPGESPANVQGVVYTA